MNKVSIEKRTDHEGNVFNTIREMCEHYGISYDLLHNRMYRLGWDIGKALTYKTRRKYHTMIFDKEYKSFSELSRVFGVASPVMSGKVYRGYDIEVAVLKFGVHDCRLIGLNMKGQNIYKYHGNYCTALDIIKDKRPDLVEAYIKSNPDGIYRKPEFLDSENRTI